MIIARNYVWLIYLAIGETLMSEVAGFSCYFAKDQCPNEDVTFWYYKKETPTTPILLNSSNINHEIFEPSRAIDILIHDFNLDRNKSPNLELRHILLQHANVNVISVDYAPLAPKPCFFPWTMENTRVVAKCLAQLLNILVDQNIFTPNKIHLIGLSLGAQIAGLTANHLDFKLGKITGLDPAAWGYRTYDPKDRLDALDAEFVDVIHTDPYLFSDINPMGHADFYPNVNSYIQPGCSILEDAINCNRLRAPVYYAESIITDVGFWSYNCGNYWQYFKKQCHHYSSEHQLMGYWVSEKARGSYFLETNSQSPFAKGYLSEAELIVAPTL